MAIEQWRAENGAFVAQWLNAVAEIEALSSLAGYSYEHPEDPFPEFTDEPGITGDLLVGIVSWGERCGGTPTVFGRVAAMRGWLASNGVPFAPGAFRTGPSTRSFGTGRPVVGDFDGDGRGDVLDYRPGSAPDTVLYGGTGATLGRARPVTINGTYRTAVCDLNGDGRDDPAEIPGMLALLADPARGCKM